MLLNNNCSGWKILLGIIFCVFISHTYGETEGKWHKTKRLVATIPCMFSQAIEVFKSTIFGNFYSKNCDKREKVTDITLEDEQFAPYKKELEPLYEVIDFMKNPRKYLGIKEQIDKNFLITGAHKDLVARALAGSLQNQNVGLIQMSDKEIESLGFYESFAFAQTQAPCILFFKNTELFDRFHHLNGNGEALSAVLTKVDEINRNMDPKKQVIVIATTNHVESIHSTFLRYGRFTTVRI
ncbi:MAG: AAA family ATPase [Candidatus Babeliaceae bacterium]